MNYIDSVKESIQEKVKKDIKKVYFKIGNKKLKSTKVNHCGNIACAVLTYYRPKSKKKFVFNRVRVYNKKTDELISDKKIRKTTMLGGGDLTINYEIIMG